jgi:hypothetical protein
MSRCAVLLCLVPVLCWGQVKGGRAVPRPAQTSQAVIDGSKTPEQIPDTVAWLVLFRIISDQPNAPDHRSRAAFLRPAGFSGDEVEIVMSAANDAMARVAAMESALTNMPNAGQKTQMLLSRRDVILTDGVNALLARLSSDAADRFRNYVSDYVKRGIKIMP